MKMYIWLILVAVVAFGIGYMIAKPKKVVTTT